jgi:segregation and condensation protein B
MMNAEIKPGSVVEVHAAAPAPPSRGEPCADQPLAARIEALLMTSDRPLSEARLAALLGIEVKGAARRVREAVEELNRAYEASGRAFRIDRLAGGWQVLTLAAFGPLLAREEVDRQQSRLSQPALETLAIIAYRQPVMRAELEAIRGVACGEVLRGLMERRLVKIVGRAEEIGRPMLYGTTAEFLKVFGMASMDDLPALDPLKAKPRDAGTRASEAAPR